MHSCLSVPFRRPWCQAGLPVKTSWLVQNPRHLGWCQGQVTSSSLQPQYYFVLNTIDTPGAFDVKTMKKWNRWVNSVFILAIWFSTNSFWGAKKIRAFPRNISDFEKQLFSSLPIANAKKCWKSKWTIKAHEARNSFCYLCLKMVIKKKKKSNEVSFPPFFGRGSSWQLNIDFLVLVWGEIILFQNFVYCRNPLRMWFLLMGGKGKLF